MGVEAISIVLAVVAIIAVLAYAWVVRGGKEASNYMLLIALVALIASCGTAVEGAKTNGATTSATSTQ